MNHHDDRPPPRVPLDRLMDEPPQGGFLDRLRARLHRRVLTGQVATLSYTAPLVVFREFLELVFALFRSDDRR